MIDFSCKKMSKVCHAYRVNRLKELVKTWHVDGVTIIEVLILVGKESGKDHDTKPNRYQNYFIKFVNKKSATTI